MKLCIQVNHVFTCGGCIRAFPASISYWWTTPQAIAAEEERTPSPLPPLPPDNIPHILTPLERRLLYDYVVEVHMNALLLVQSYWMNDDACFITHTPAWWFTLRQKHSTRHSKNGWDFNSCVTHSCTVHV